MKISHLFYCLSVLLIGTAGCAIPDNTAEFWTNIPEMTTYADLFNSQQDSHRIKIVYKEDPGTSLLTENNMPDLIVSTNLNSGRFESLLEDLSPLLDPGEGSLKAELFYKELLESGTGSDGLQRTLPVSFNLPLLYHHINNGITLETEGLTSREELMEEGKKFIGSNDFPVRDFSPLWSGHYIYELAKLNGTGFMEADRGLPVWNMENLERTLTDIKELSPAAPPRKEDEEDYPPEGSLEWELAFQDKYLYQPWFKSVNSGRILYAFTTMRDFQQIPTGERKSLRFKWLSDGKKVPVCDDILYAGILRRGEDKKSAAAFLEWFFKLETQSGILESSQFKRIRSFGIAKGFSSLYLVNELEFPRFYPILVGIIPGQNELLFPQILPQEWNRISGEVVIPWLLEEARQTGQNRPLGEIIQDWYNLHPSL